ncbi:MAG TPA: GTPase Era [Thermoanaerobaculia bacterium]
MEPEGIQARYAVIAIIGRPNAGKSTLLNRLLGTKVAAVSDKPQTTRNRIVGILNEPRGQLVFLDTPGIHKPLHKLNVRMMDHVVTALAEADIVALMIDATEKFGHGDQFVIDLLKRSRPSSDAKRFVLVNKVDKVPNKAALLPTLKQYGEFALFDELIPISAEKGDNVDELLDLFFQYARESAPRYPTEEYTTQPERFFAAEMIREKLLRHTEKELPYTTAVAVDKWEEDEAKNLLRIWATIFVERDSQKPIVIGKGASKIKRIGTEAREDLERILGTKIFLDLHVAVRESWREDERFLGELEWPMK